MLDALLGTGTSKSVSNAQTTGFSTATKSVCLFRTNAQPSITLEHVLAASKATTSKTENAHKPQLCKFQTSDALLGTGTNKPAFSAQTTGFSMNMESVFQYPINAQLSIEVEPALLATRDTTLIMENALSLLLNKCLM